MSIDTPPRPQPLSSLSNFFRIKNYVPVLRNPHPDTATKYYFHGNQNWKFYLKLDVRTLNPWYFKHGKFILGGGSTRLFIHICSAIVLFFVCWRCTSVTLHIVGNYSFFGVRLLPFENLSNTDFDSKLLFVCTAQINKSEPTNELDCLLMYNIR